MIYSIKVKLCNMALHLEWLTNQTLNFNIIDRPMHRLINQNWQTRTKICGKFQVPNDLFPENTYTLHPALDRSPPWP